MFFILFVVLCLLCLWLFYHRLTFLPGRLTRAYDENNTKPLTSMGRDQFVELSFGKVHYIYRPSSSSSILHIFVHGYSTPMEMWEDVFDALVADGHSCLVFDLYGRGWSDSPSVPMNIDLFVSQMAELLYALNLPHEKYHLYGVSMGGAIVQRFTELYTSKVSKLILCCSAGLGLAKPSRLQFFLLSLPLIGPIVFKFTLQRGDEKRVRSQWARPHLDYYRRYRERFHTACRDHPGYLRSLFSTLTHFNFEELKSSIDKIRQSKIPVLIIWGDQDNLIPIENAYEFHRLYPSLSTLTIIPGATHMLLIEHSKEVIEVIRENLKNSSN